MRKMKDSGIDWIGAIPEDWETGKTLYALSMPITDGPHETPTLYSEGIPFVSAEAVSCGNGKIDFNHIRGYISEEFYDECCKKYTPEINDIYMIKSGATTGKVAIVDTDKVFTIWSPLAVFRCDKNRMYHQYLYYFLQSDSYQKQLENNWSYGTQQNIGMRILEKLIVCFPPYTEQEKIANFLDDKCARLDEIIAKQHEVIEKLNAYKLSVITEIVSKGLNKDVPMKDSGIDWIGDIPEYASVTRVGHLYKSILGKMLSSTPNSDDDTLEDYFCAINVHFDGIDYENIKQMWFNEKEKEIYAVQQGDLLVVEGGAGAGGAAVVERDIENCYVQNSIHIVRPTSKKVNAKFLYYTLFSLVKRNYIDFVCNKATIPHFTKDKLLNVPVVVLDDVDEITDYLDKKCAAIDESIAKRQQLIEKLTEYKKSLIFEVVTGKKEI